MYTLNCRWKDVTNLKQTAGCGHTLVHITILVVTIPTINARTNVVQLQKFCLLSKVHGAIAETSFQKD